MYSAPSFLEILKVLSRHEVEFILVGGMAAILEGAPVSTFDLDTVFFPANLDLPEATLGGGPLSIAQDNSSGV